MTTRPKRMLVHTYNNGEWSSREYPSVRQMHRSLRQEGISFGQDSAAGLGSNSVILIKGDVTIEIEEAVEDEGKLQFRGRVYTPVKGWAEKNGTTVRKARYAYQKGRLEGMVVGNRNYLYIRDDACTGKT